MPPAILPRSQHNLSRQSISPEALKVLYRLHRAGFVAYLVGGGVRDLLLGRRPKDFDISTSAHPGEVRKLFRNCRLIGRRFRLAHVIFGRNHIIEVSTFRRKAAEVEEGDDLLVRSDNTFGTPEEDAERRDITINGLFYDIATFSVIDHVGGLKDLEERTIRTIGSPAVRMREDPVRMLRVIKFAARLGFHIAEEDFLAIREHGAELLRTSPERLRLELGRLLSEGSSAKAFQLMKSTGLLSVLFPTLDRQWPEDPERWFPELAALDEETAASRDAGKEEPSPAAQLATLLSGTSLASGGSSPASPSEHRRGLGFATHRPTNDGPRLRSRSPLDHGDYARAQAAMQDFVRPLFTQFNVPRREGERTVEILMALSILGSNDTPTPEARQYFRRAILADVRLVAHLRQRAGLLAESTLKPWHTLLEPADGGAQPRRGRQRRSNESEEPPDTDPTERPTSQRRRRRRPRDQKPRA